MNALPAWLRYTLLRVLLFAAPLAVLLIAGVTPWIAVLVAALFGFSASLIFLRASREQLASDLYAARHRETPAVTVDDEAEDAALDGMDGVDGADGVDGVDGAGADAASPAPRDARQDSASG
ncbi:DUF4229 domain-containing protein [Agromyces marinus]|uniref:DUF4229 domain-containing protein n=1 Tax=Agromyces marinus TaxID=1389020 RepID=A0ABN6YBH0_9MICO|nr:DUF4229 domain-containing protein [Agromyces marinus]UIP57473.1 hypothetical protein DSM26151_03340 [Agromyces marinus]BDZ54396.1 hypothetical protein GCM10025870_14690 [Agromyces marinus]